MVDRVPTIDEIDSGKKLEAYLKTRSTQEAQAIAYRAALRNYPGAIAAVQPIFSQLDADSVRSNLLGIFRAAFVGWQLLRFPDEPNEIAAIRASFESTEKCSASIGIAVLSLGVAHALKVALASISRANLGYKASTEQFWSEVRADCQFLARNTAKDLMAISIWSSGAPPATAFITWINTQKTFEQLGMHWNLVRDWFDVVSKSGTILGSPQEPRFILPYPDLLAEEFWQRDPDVVIKEISERLRGEPSENEATLPPPSEPESGPGPQYDIIGGKLGIVASPPAFHEIEVQTRLFDRLRRDVEHLVSAAHKIHNSHPNLAFSIREYAELLDTPLEALDVTGVWAVGGSLAGFAQSFREQNRNRTLAEPLEPEVDGLLQSVIRQHGAFIMGFEEGRDLVDRADRFALDTDTLRSLEESGNPLIAELASNADLVNDDARAVHRSVNDYLQEFGWASARNGYSGFLIIQNAVRAIIKFVIHNEFVRNAVLDKFGNAFLSAASTFLSNFSASLLAVFANFPEMRAYVQCVLGLMEHDRQLMQ